MAEKTDYPPFSWNFPTTKYLPIKLFDIKEAEKGLPLSAKIGIGLGVTAVGVAGAVIASPFVIAAAGFTAGGVATLSAAAAWKSAIGSVAAGSLFASLQSSGIVALGGEAIRGAAVRGAAVLGAAVGGAAVEGVAVGEAAVGGIIVGGVKRSVPLKAIDEVFQRYVNFKYEIVSYENLKIILNDLKLALTDEQLKEMYTTTTGREEEGLITYEEYLRLFGVRLLKGEEFKCKLTQIFNKKTMFYIIKEIYLKDLEGMLKYLGILFTESYIEESYRFVKELEGENVKTENASVSLDVFLKMCGCEANPNFDLVNVVNFYEKYKQKDEKIDLKDLFNFFSTISTDLTLLPIFTFFVSLEEYLEFFEIGMKCEPLKAVLLFKLSLTYSEFKQLGSSFDNKISLTYTENMLSRRGITGENFFLKQFENDTKEGKRIFLNFFQFLKSFGTYVDFHRVLNKSEIDINPHCYIHTFQLLEYLVELKFNLNAFGTQNVWNAVKRATDDDSPRYLSYFEFLKVLLLLDELNYHHILIIPENKQCL